MSAEQLIYAEEFALYGAQLLGRSLGHVSILERRRGWHLAEEASLQPRAQSLRYMDVNSGLLHGLRPSGVAETAGAMPVLDEDLVLREMERLGVPLEPFWQSAEFAAARDADILAWLPGELRSTEPPGSTLRRGTNDDGPGHLMAIARRGEAPEEDDGGACRPGSSQA